MRTPAEENCFAVLLKPGRGFWMNKAFSALALKFENLLTRFGLGMRGKLITLFVVIKVLPLILLALIAWRQSWMLGEELDKRTLALAEKANSALSQTGDLAVGDAVKALDDRAREDIERMTTDTARRVADFLYTRDDDIRLAAALPHDAATYREFLRSRTRNIVVPGKWELSPDGKFWRPAANPAAKERVTSSIRENERNFHYRPDDGYAQERRPLYLEMTFLDPDGRELVKVTTSELMDPELKNVSLRRNTFIKAETYFQDLKKLRPGEIYVSDVIGA